MKIWLPHQFPTYGVAGIRHLAPFAFEFMHECTLPHFLKDTYNSDLVLRDKEACILHAFHCNVMSH